MVLSSPHTHAVGLRTDESEQNVFPGHRNVVAVYAVVLTTGADAPSAHHSPATHSIRAVRGAGADGILNPGGAGTPGKCGSGQTVPRGHVIGVISPL
jgi:hypothetical protein